MSSKPHPEGVAEIVDVLEKVATLESEARELQPKADRLRAVETELGMLRRGLPEKLRAMDLESTGNFGWEGRMGWFLAEMRRQLLAGSKYEKCRICGSTRENHSPEYWDEHQRAAALDP